MLSRYQLEDGSNYCAHEYPNEVDILGNGTLGAHGGSGLSAMGGTVRRGELVPGAPPIRHALKIEFYGAMWYWGSSRLQAQSHQNCGNAQYYPPAINSDDGTYKCTCFGCCDYQGPSPFVAPGALLAIPPSVNASTSSALAQLKHPVARQLRDAAIQFGAYLVDSSSGYANKVSFCMEAGVDDEIVEHYNVSMAFPHGVAGHQDLYLELLVVLQNLHAVTGNRTVGEPLAPPPPAICGV